MMIKFLLWLKRFDFETYIKVNLKCNIKNYINKKFKMKNKYELAIIDDTFPREKPLGFRNNSINFMLDNIKNTTYYCMYPMLMRKKSQIICMKGKNYKNFKHCLKSYSKYYPQNNRKIEYLPERLHNKLVYCYFLAETYTLLPYLNANQLPFIFVLFPGGMFGINNEFSDAMLREIFSSPYFKKVITTTSLAKKYLLENNFCNEDKIFDNYCGGYSPFSKEEVKKEQKFYYPKDKDTIDICFCAFKHSPMGFDKGYDLFISVAKKLVLKYSHLRFHVIGPFDENDIDVKELEDKIKFYGILQKEELKKIYLKIDMFVTPNRPSVLYKGNFDGFPLHGTSAFLGCTLLNTDEYKINTHFKNMEDVVIIRPDINDIYKKIEYLINNMDRTYEIGKNGQMKFFEVFYSEKNVEKFFKLIENILEDLNK